MIARRSLLRTRIQRILDGHCSRARRPSLAIRLLLLCALGLQGGLVSFALLPVALPAATGVAPVDSKVADEVATNDDWLLSGQVVDVAAQPAAGASVLIYANNYWNFRRTLVTDAQGQFSYRLNDELGEFTDLEIVARSADGRSLVVDGASRPRRGQASPALKLQLEPERQIELQVVDQTGQAVAAAKAAVKIKGLYLTESTNAKGIATFKVPERQHIACVAAWKNQVGLDFVAYEPPMTREVGSPRIATEFPASGVQQLKLTGAKTVPIFVTDIEGRPLPNIKVSVGQFDKPNAHSFATSNLEAFSQERFCEPTDALGRTEIACVPHWQEDSLQYWPNARDYEIKFITHPVWSDEPVRLKLERKVSIRGRVTLPDGQPANGIRVTASGDTYTNSVVEDHAMTSADGRYELFVPPNHLYMVAIEGEAVAAAAQTIVLRSGQSTDNLDFQLRPATRVTGRVIDKDSGEPIADASLFLDQYGPTQRTANTALPEAYAVDSAPWNAPRVHRSAETDASGRYEFSLGDGEFELHTGMAGGSRTIHDSR